MMSYLKRVTPIIVTYNPSTGVLSKLLASLDHFKTVQLVDNGSYNAIALKELCSKYENVQSSFLNSNIGLAEAQNKAIEELEDEVLDGAFILLLDQDSVPIDNFIAVLYEHAIGLMNADVKLAVIGPALVDTYSDSRFGFIRKGKRFYIEDTTTSVFQCDGVNSSGSLIPLAVWKELGGNNPQLFIDHVETDWCFRVRAAGYVCYGTFDAAMSHSMGESTLRYWLFGWRTMPDRTPERHYYLFRNSMFLQKQNYVPSSWKIKNTIKLLLTMGYFGVFHPQRIKQLLSMYIGIKDGVTGKFGVRKIVN